MTILTYKTKLKFDSEQDKKAIIAILELERDIFNFCSIKCFNIEKNSIVLLHKLCYKEAKNQFPNSKSQIIIKAENNCLSAYKSTKSNKHKIKKPIVKKRLATHFDKRLYSYKDGILRLTTLNRRVACRLTLYSKLENALSKGKFCDPVIFSDGKNVFASLTFRFDNISSTSNSYVLGVDLGIRRLAATSQGNLYIDKEFNKRKRKLRYLKRMLNSKGTKSAKRHFRKLRNKEKHINHNFTHHLANKILSTNCGIIALEDLNCKSLKAKRSKYQNKNRISQIGFAQLKFILTYKAELLNKKVVCVNPAYTSQIDCVTGKKLGERRGCRFYSLRGLVYDADVNAAVNIASRTNLPVSYRNILDGQAIVNSPIVGKL